MALRTKQSWSYIRQMNCEGLTNATHPPYQLFQPEGWHHYCYCNLDYTVQSVPFYQHDLTFEITCTSPLDTLKVTLEEKQSYCTKTITLLKRWLKQSEIYIDWQKAAQEVREVLVSVMFVQRKRSVFTIEPGYVVVKSTISTQKLNPVAETSRRDTVALHLVENRFSPAPVQHILSNCQNILRVVGIFMK